MTVTANIHIGLTAWTNSTYTLGARISTGGNAYQCITACMSLIQQRGMLRRVPLYDGAEQP